jgi:CheY-like chemotaxis protein
MGNTILLADKSITIQKIVELTFADEDFVIRSVNDGHTALEVIPQFHPDIVLADIGLPGLNGYDLCTTLRTDSSFAEFSNTPVILLAGIYETMDEERAKQVEERVKNVGANDYLSKPFDSQLLTEKVKAFLAGMPPKSLDDTAPGEMASPTVTMFTESAPLPEEKTASFNPEEFALPPDDTEKTMMIQGGPVFSNSMFAEKSPFEEQGSDHDMAESHTVKITGQDLEAARAAYSRGTREESTSRPGPDDSQPFGVESTLSMQVSSIDLPGSTEIMPGNDEPFGNVFEESTARWRLTPLGEEENPFGLPEQEMPTAVAPAIIQENEKISEPEPDTEPIRSFQVEEVEPESEFATATFQRDTVVEHAFLAQDAEPEEEPDTVTIEPKTADDYIEEEAVQNESALEDTWPGTRSIPLVEEPAESVMEELVASDTSKMSTPEVEEFDNKPQEMTEVPVEFDSVSSNAEEALEEPVQPVATSALPAEIPQELVDRIVEKVMARLSERVISEIVWQVVPDLAEKMIRRELDKIQTGEE